MKDANIPKFSELKEKVASLSDMTEVEDYLKDALKRKENWDSASNEVT